MADFLSDSMFDPASDEEQNQAHADRVTYRTTFALSLGGGEMHDLGKGMGPVVGGSSDQYSDDPMGETRSMQTYTKSRNSSRGDAAENNHAPLAKMGKDKGMISGGVKK